ncbi:Cytochrome c oxidase assembly protein cox11, mitochondrial [Paecilomyces lecythidis]|uniref:Cytochrome c oxidase assembly protein cox11, mitochondrial n=1 Tax=Paecilomyces lecythidis TaxID=3004212 RepID=A0ABR3Y782_9EURO
MMWDSGLCVGAGCLLCGWSVLVEGARRRQELALFVAPRAAATLLPRRYEKKYEYRERAAFALSIAVIFTCLQERPEFARGFIGRIGAQLETHETKDLRYYTISIIIGTIALAYGSVPLYKMICQQTGWNGQPVSTHRVGDGDTSTRVKPVTDARRLRITFNGSVSDVLPWKFTPQQREVRVLPGETALAFYTATNRGPADIIGVATYSVTPAQVAPYFSKIQCFCFEEQKLNAGETVDMPVFFFIDPDFVKDPTMKGIDTITLSYTFFKARYDSNGVLKPTPGS